MTSIKEQTCALLDSFRNCCQRHGMQIQQPVSLVCRHDPTLMFTNSTTSVLKPYILQTVSFPEKGIFLAQPAMGMQGVRFWLNTASFGHFSSFFYSLGTLSPMDSLSVCVQAALDFLTAFFGDLSSTVFSYSHKDEPLLRDILDTLEGCLLCPDTEGHFRHAYGIAGITGVDVNISCRTCYGNVEFGNFSVICSDNTPLCVEFSVDSTLILSACLQRHAVCCLPSADAAQHLLPPTSNHASIYAFLDFIDLACMLTMDGLKSASKGRGRYLKVICRQLHMLSVELGVTADELAYIIESTVKDELIIAEHSGYVPALYCEQDIRRHILEPACKVNNKRSG